MRGKEWWKLRKVFPRRDSVNSPRGAGSVVVDGSPEPLRVGVSATKCLRIAKGVPKGLTDLK